MDDRALAGAGALVVAMRECGIRDEQTLAKMTLDEQRNTFIVELAGFTGLGGSLQAKDNLDLVKIGLTGSHGVRGVLLGGRILSWQQLNPMSFDDQRNALINTLASHSAHSVGHYQGLSDAELAGCGGILMLLRDCGVRDPDTLKTMTTDDQRNTLIVEIDSFIRIGDRLQAYSSADEPYAVITTFAPEGSTTIKTQIYEDVDSGDSRSDDNVLYAGPGHGIALDVILREYDFGDPDTFKEQVSDAVAVAGGGITAALIPIPLVGPALAGLFAAAWAKYQGDIANAVNKALDTDDDTIGRAQMLLTRAQLKALAAAPEKEFRGVMFKIETPLLSSGGADYKLAFDVQRMPPR